MSDYQEYDDGNEYGDYEEEPMEVEEDYETKVDLDFYEAEEMLRKGKTADCLQSLQELYTLSEQHNLRNWKVKILNLLLQIHCKSNDTALIRSTLEKISELNKGQRYTEYSIKAIIITIKSLPTQIFDQNKEVVYGFLQQLDSAGKVRSYLLFLEKAVEERNFQEADGLFALLDKLISEESENIPGGCLIELYSLEIKYAGLTKKNIKHRIRNMELKISTIESEIYMSEGHISVIKQAIAESMYEEQNFQDCAAYLCESFQQNMKFGKQLNSEQILKINTLVVLLSNNEDLFQNPKFNSLYHDSASSFMTKSDVQALYPLIEAYKDKDLCRFVEESKAICLVDQPPAFKEILQKTLNKLKQKKILQIIKPYSRIKLSYLQRRLHCQKSAEVRNMIFDLIAGEQISGRLRMEKQSSDSECYLQVNSPQDTFVKGQAANIRQVMKRHLKY